MDTSYLLAQFFGLFSIFVGFTVLTRREILRLFALRLIERPTVMFGFGIVLFALGLLLVLSHNIWSTLWQALISLYAWLILLKGFVYMAMPSTAYKSIVKRYYSSSLLTVGGVVFIIIGIYLTIVGF